MKGFGIIFALFIQCYSINTENYYQYSYLKNTYYKSYHNMNILKKNCEIFQFNPISDNDILYSVTFLDNKNQSNWKKGTLSLNYRLQNMTCFNVIPPIENISQLCLIAVGNTHSNFLVWSNQNFDFLYGMVTDKTNNEECFRELSYVNYKNSSIKYQNC
jgi:hypothetical protein